MPSRAPHSLVLSVLLVACGGESSPTAPTPSLAPTAPTAPIAPERVESPSDPVAVARGLQFACVLRRGGRVACWRPLRTRDANPSRTAVEVQGLDDAVALALGNNTACAVRRGGSVVCWREGRYERRGLVAVTGISDATSLAHESPGFCAIRRDGRVSCWGGDFTPIVPPGSDHGPSLVETTLRGVHALRLKGESQYALLEGGRAMTWTQGGTSPPRELPDVSDATTSAAASCTQSVEGEVRCHFPRPPSDVVIDAWRGATAIELSNMVALMPDGTLVLHDASARMASVTNIAQLATDSGPTTAITRDGRVLEWATRATSEGVLAATEITLPALGTPPPVEALPEGRIPRWCNVQASWLPRSEPTSLEALRGAVLGAPRAGQTWTQASLCESAEVSYGSPDCPTEGPWLAVGAEDEELTLVVALARGEYARIPGLGNLATGSEETVSLGYWELLATHPLEARLGLGGTRLECSDEEGCVHVDMDGTETMVREIGGRFLAVEVSTDRRHAPPASELDVGATALEVEGNTLHVWACGGDARLPLPAQPALVTEAANEAAVPATEAEAQAASAQCADGWRAFGAGDFERARTTIDAALTVLERAQDTSAVRARGACLYNRGRVAEQDQDIPAARGFYQRSIAARPNDVVAQRLAALP